jgi:hypothetical protein
MTAASRRPNPFHVLALPVDADRQDIVERGEDGLKTAPEDERELHDWAMRELISNERTRQRHALTEAPGTDYRDRRWEKFARRYRTAPAGPRTRQLGPEDFDVPEAVRAILRELLRPLPDGTRTALQDLSPTPGDDPEPELEVGDVLFG